MHDPFGNTEQSTASPRTEPPKKIMATEHIIVGTDDTQADSAAILAPDLHRQAAPDAALAKTFYAHRRGPFGSKHIFTEAEGPGRYWVFNPVPQKHANTWKPVLWRGDNPKYCPESARIGKARRTGFWNSFKIHLGDGMQEVLLNNQRRAKKRSYERGQKMRRWFRMKPTPPKNPLEEEKVVTDLVMSLTMKRPKGMGRSLKWSLGGEQYTWKGTRRFLPARVKGWRGISHDFKVSHAAVQQSTQLPIKPRPPTSAPIADIITLVARRLTRSHHRDVREGQVGVV